MPRSCCWGSPIKPNIADQRESPAIPIANVLREKKARLQFHDPGVETWNSGHDQLERVPDLMEAVADADIVVLLQDHRDYEVSKLSRAGEDLLRHPRNSREVRQRPPALNPSNVVEAQ